MEKTKEIPKYSYIGEFSRKAVLRQVENTNENLAIIRKFMESHGETLQDLIRYSVDGWDYEINQRVEEMKKWLSENHAPDYLFEGSEQKAVESIGETRLEYLQKIGSVLPVMYDGKPINLNTDLNDNWELTEDFINTKLEERRIVLSDDEIEDLELCLKAGDILREVQERRLITENLLAFDRSKDISELCELLNFNYKADFNPSIPSTCLGL